MAAYCKQTEHSSEAHLVLGGNAPLLLVFANLDNLSVENKVTGSITWFQNFYFVPSNKLRMSGFLLDVRSIFDSVSIIIRVTVFVKIVTIPIIRSTFVIEIVAICPPISSYLLISSDLRRICNMIIIRPQTLNNFRVKLRVILLIRSIILHDPIIERIFHMVSVLIQHSPINLTCCWPLNHFGQKTKFQPKNSKFIYRLHGLFRFSFI